VEKGVTPY